MIDHLLAELTVLVHFAFLVFVVAGGLLARRYRALVLPHLLAFGWGLYVEVLGVICPLTHWENAFRHRAGEAGYEGGFIEHYLLRVLYPEGLTRGMQWWLAGALVAINAAAYGWPRHRRSADRPAA